MLDRRVLAPLLAAVLLLLAVSPAAASGRIVPPSPPVRVGAPPAISLRSLQVAATVEDGVARVQLDQIFVNQTNLPAEGTYLFPIPPGASVSSFAMTIDGKPYQAELLDADKARSLYESIVRQNRDPALLQYVGQGLLQARVFPIPAGAERRLRVEYEQVLPREGGLWELTLPLGQQSVPQAVITVDVKGALAGSLYSPTHQVGVTRRPDGSARASFEGSDVSGDFRLIFGRESDEVSASLLTYKTGSEDGYFLLLVNPPVSSEARLVSKDVLLVIDLSGSMAGEKFEQAKGAALQILGALGADDRFAVIGFHGDTVAYADELRGASEAGEAMAYVRNMRLGGATNISEAMARAQRMAGRGTGRPQVIILVTDGQPTAGEQNPERIVEQVRSAATSSQRIFTFGVGFDVNTHLLDAMAQENRGRSQYVQPGENLESAVAAFWQKVGQPVLADVKLQWEGVTVSEVYPRPLPDLYLGTQLVLMGRYRKGADAKLTISGVVDGQQQSYRFTNLRFAEKETTRDYIPRLWANRKVGYLLSEIRRTGPDTERVNEVIALSQRFGIVTPYTSFYVPEPVNQSAGAAPGSAPRGGIRLPTFGAGKPTAEAVARDVAAAPSSGQIAVEEAKSIGRLADAQSLQQVQTAPGAASGQVRTAGEKSFVLQQGVWVDTAYTAGVELLHLALGSDQYLELVRTRPDLAKFFAVGSPLILADGAKAFAVDLGEQESPGVLSMAAPGPDGGPGRGAGIRWWYPVALALLAAAGVVFWLRRRTQSL